MKQISSLITTNPKEINLLMSTQPTETGLGMQLNSKQRELAIKKLTEVANPFETEKELLSTLKSYHTYPPRISYSFGEYTRIRIYESTYKSKEMAEKAYTAVASTMVGLPIEDCVKRLVHLSALTQKPFNETGEDLSVRIKALGERLSIYPADIVIMALRELSIREKNFPTSFSQYYQHIESWYLSRKTLLVDTIKGMKANYE